MRDSLGFTVERSRSRIKGAGTGVIVTSGRVPKGAIVAMYPGTVYYPSEPILLQSMGNPFVFRCVDHVYIDGNDKGVSRWIHKSCARREVMGPHRLCDMSWLTSDPVNPLAIGQYVNNQNGDFPANVAYQEFRLPPSFPLTLRKYLPNVHYSMNVNAELSARRLRMIALISLRDIEEGEEVLSSYFTIIH